jgi:16S rRNA G966 N2-methylase RsmD
MGVRFVMDKATILTENNKKQEYLTFKNSLLYSFKNGSIEVISIDDYTIINDTDERLIIEKIECSRFSTSNSGENYMTSISPYSSKILNYSIDYFYIDPPYSIRVKNTATNIRYWLHK